MGDNSEYFRQPGHELNCVSENIALCTHLHVNENGYFRRSLRRPGRQLYCCFRHHKESLPLAGPSIPS